MNTDREFSSPMNTDDLMNTDGDLDPHPIPTDHSLSPSLVLVQTEERGVRESGWVHLWQRALVSLPESCSLHHQMNQRLKKTLLLLFVATYVAASQITVLSIISAWYSTAADSAVERHQGPTKEFGVPAWVPRTHLPAFQQSELSPAAPSSPFVYQSERTCRIIQAQRPLQCFVAFYFSDLCNKAPPRS